MNNIKEIEEILKNHNIDISEMSRRFEVAKKAGLIEGENPYETLLTELSALITQREREADERFEIATRLYLQDMWNDQSEIQALSPEGETIIWGGKVGETITEEWEKLKGKLSEAEAYLSQTKGDKR